MWKPSLEGSLAQDAARVVREIAVEVAAAPLAGRAAGASPADRVLFWAYATPLLDEPFAHAAYVDAIDDAWAALHAGVDHPGLHDGGLAGLGWTLAHVLDRGVDDVLAVIDEALVATLATWTGGSDLAHGLAGLGVYFADRLAANPGAALPRTGLLRVTALLAHEDARTPGWQPTPDVGGTDLASGSAGLAHVLNRFYQATQDPSLLEAATLWFERTLAAYHAHGVAAFRGPATSEHGLLDGSIGVGLALLAAISPVDPRWDRLVLVEPPAAVNPDHRVRLAG